MERKYDNAMHRLVDRGEWQHTWHMKGKFGHVDWYDKDNLAVVEREIYAAREAAALLERLATEAEESMRAHMPNVRAHAQRTLCAVVCSPLLGALLFLALLCF